MARTNDSNLPLLDDVVVLAGATGRVGKATLGALLRDGASHVAVLSRAAANAERVIAEVASGSDASRAVAIEADLADAAWAERQLAETVRRFGRIDAVVSLAGGGSPFVAIADSTDEDLATSVRNNLTVAYNLMVPSLRIMLRQRQREGTRSKGRLVAVTAGSSLDPQPRFGIMGVGKAGVNTLMRAIAREHKGDGIVANAVVLGTVATEQARDYLSAEDFAAAASPEEVADILAFHAGDRSSSVNGELIHLNAREVD
jgi:NAD(P)-dependent dehydrogenase (short-subunit alcohol dehydrogenase family)